MSLSLKQRTFNYALRKINQIKKITRKGLNVKRFIATKSRWSREALIGQLAGHRGPGAGHMTTVRTPAPRAVKYVAPIPALAAG